MRKWFVSIKKSYIILALLVCFGTAILIFTGILFNNDSTQIQTDNSVSADHETDVTDPTLAVTASTGNRDGEKEILLDVQPILQDNYAGACESYAAVTLLNFYGYPVDDFQFIEDYLHTESLSFYDGVYYGPSLFSAFAGTPDDGYGVYAPSVNDSINQYLADENSPYRANIETNCTLEELCDGYVSKGEPVMVWGTIDMQEPYDYVDWVINYADDNSRLKSGDVFSWPTNEHCMIMIGYDDNNFYFADSLDAAVVSYPKTDCQKAFEALESQAIYLAKEKA